MSFGSISIRARLISAFSMFLLALAGICTFSVNRIAVVNEFSTEMAHNWMPSIHAIGALNKEFSDLGAITMKHVLSTSDADMARVEKELSDTVARIEEERSKYEKLISSSQERALYDTFSEQFLEFIKAKDTALGLSRRNDNEQARDYINAKVVPLLDAVDETLGKLVAMNLRGGENASLKGDEVYSQTMSRILVSAAIIMLAGISGAVLIVRSISRGISSVVAPMQQLAGGNLDVTIPSRGEKTEIGTIADAVQVFKLALIERRQLEEEAKTKEAEASAERRRMRNELADTFQSAVGGLVQSLSAAATEMEASAQSMTSIADQTSRQSVTVASAAEQTSSNVQTVAAATEELSISIREIASQVAHSSRISGQAVQDAQRANDTVQTLASAADQIGNVVSLIHSIAGQTNLLALNATIEAARAGDAGKGFAVVATEVKELASQTAKATEDISHQIGSVQQATERAVQAIHSVVQTIGEMSQISVAIAAAMDEQGAATSEIARNVQEAARGTEQVTGSIGTVQQGAAETGVAATQVMGSAQELARSSSILSHEVSNFLSGIRAA